MYLILRFYIGPSTSSTIATNGGGGGVVAATRGIAAEFSLLAYIKSTAAKLTGYGRLHMITRLYYAYVFARLEGTSTYIFDPTLSNFRGRVEIPEERKLVINSTTQPTLETRPSRMNEVNSDFADRSQFHQAHTVQG